MRAPLRLRRRAIAVTACVVGAASVGLASCSLGLDEALIVAGAQEAGTPDVVVSETSIPEGGDGALPPIMPEAGICTKDSDCKGTDGCFAAKCDIPRKACVLQVCRTPACNSSSCNLTASKCDVPKPYKYRAGQYPVNAGIGCGGALGRCFAAVYPYVFVGTTNGVVAFSGNDPQSVAPLTVPITGLGFVPAQIVASGSRVYFLGAAAGTPTASRVQIAYADVPPDPFAKKIAVTTVLPTFNRPVSDPLTLLARGSDTALLVDGNVASAYASVAIEPPLTEPAALVSTGFAVTAGSVPLATSGSRLIVGQINPVSMAVSFGFVNAAGSMAPQPVAEVAIPTATPASAPQVFAQSADGAVFWSYTSLTVAVPPGGPLVRAVKGYFLVADGAAAFDPAAGLDLEIFGGVPLGTPSVGPVAMLDGKTAMVLTANPPNPTAVTNVQFVTRQPLAIVKNTPPDITARRFQLPVAVGQLAATGSNGLGYVLAIDPNPAVGLTVYVFDPACAP